VGVCCGNFGLRIIEAARILQLHRRSAAVGQGGDVLLPAAADAQAGLGARLISPS